MNFEKKEYSYMPALCGAYGNDTDMKLVAKESVDI
jgi:hypothetical protein